MKLPGNIVIPADKLLRYLLLPREENDKSIFLAMAGYTLVNWERLERDLYELAMFHDISASTISPYGIKYDIRGTLTGPNSKILHVVTVWITLEAIGETRFVTLFPDREANR